MNDERTHELVAAWHTADDYRTRLQRRWPLIRLVMWLLAAPAVVLLVLGYSAVYPIVLTVAGLAIAGDHALREMYADRARSEAWQALVEHTSRSGASLGRLLDEDAGDEHTSGGER